MATITTTTPPENLTGWTVTVPSGWTAEAGYFDGGFDADISVNGNSYGTIASFLIGYSFDWVEGEIITESDNIFIQFVGMDIRPSDTFTLTNIGTTNSTNSSLIQWLVDNKATFSKEEEGPQVDKTNNLAAFLKDLYQGIVKKKPDASKNPQDFRSEIEAIETGGGGLDINGVIREYEVNAGASVSAGDFVEFVNKLGNSGFNIGNSSNISACKLDNNRVLITYQDGGNSSYGTAVVLNIEGGSVIVGTETVFNSATTSYISTVALTDSKVLVAYRNGGNSNYGTVITLSVEGLEISINSSIVLTTESTQDIYTAFLTDSKVLVAYRSGIRASAVVLTISGTTVTVGTAKKLLSGTANPFCAVALTDSKVLVGFNNYANTRIDAVVLTISGTTVTEGTAKEIYSEHNNYTGGCSAVALTDSKVLVVYGDANNSNYGMAVVLTISGTTITVGTKKQFCSTPMIFSSTVALTDSKVLVAYYNSASKYGMAVVLTISGTTVTVGTAKVFDEKKAQYNSLISLSETTAFVMYTDGDAGKYLELLISDTTITINEQLGEVLGTFIQKATTNGNVGVAKTAGAEGETVEVYCAV